MNNRAELLMQFILIFEESLNLFHKSKNDHAIHT